MMFPIVILAGGLATRLRPITDATPKALIEINGEPFINHQLRLLHKNNIRDVVLCLSYRGDMIEKHVGTGNQFGMNIQYSYDGETLLGTGGAIKKALPLLAENFFVIYGDSYLNCDYAATKAKFIAQQKNGLMTVFRNHGQWDASNVEFNNDKIITYDKTQRNAHMLHIDYGLGVFNKRAFSLVPENTTYDLAELYQALLQQQQLAAYEVSQRFYEVGSFAGIKELAYYLTPHEVKI